ncbi:hypothetical protein PFLUV_G00134300 [Perca fluviatilis]|uniref:Uncharacterized protein n=1 Tax=Perca fluviatilis TaxID=8168 RepID=A0A6A5F548_PERFL|nr:hypothetical protein PFLUV_G00134300 [Perca fluviatilis]
MYLQGNGCGWTKRSWTTLTGLKVNLVIAATAGLALQLGSGVQAIGSILDHTFAKQPKYYHQHFQHHQLLVVVDLGQRGHIPLAIVVVITGIAIGVVTALFLFKKVARRLPVPDTLITFDNPVFSNEWSQPNVVDTNDHVENLEEKSPEPLITQK